MTNGNVQHVSSIENNKIKLLFHFASVYRVLCFLHIFSLLINLKHHRFISFENVQIYLTLCTGTHVYLRIHSRNSSFGPLLLFVVTEGICLIS